MYGQIRPHELFDSGRSSIWSSDFDPLSVFSAPFDIRRRISISIALELDSGANFDLNIAGSLVRIDIRWDLHVQSGRLEHHGVSVDLTHVLTTVTLLHISNVQIKGGFEVAREGNARVMSYDLLVKGQNSFGIKANPANLDTIKICSS